MKSLFGFTCIVVILLVGATLYYYRRWRTLWQCEEALPAYHVEPSRNDTLRVIFIGDSWVGMRRTEADSSLQKHLSTLTGRPVRVWSSGRGGAKSRDIYRLMFEVGGYGTRPLIAKSPDYCVISAGINDAAANLGTRQYVHHVKLMVDFLAHQGIKPVVLEAPDVNIWTIYGDKPAKDLVGDYVKSRMTGCGMYHYAEYREALEALAEADKRVLLIPVQQWNGEYMAPSPTLYLGDSIHLNNRGYARLDSCIAANIAKDSE